MEKNLVNKDYYVLGEEEIKALREAKGEVLNELIVNTLISLNYQCGALGMKMEGMENSFDSIKGKVEKVEGVVDGSMIEELSMKETGELNKVRTQKMYKLLGSPSSPRYKVFSRLYYKQMAKDVYIAFGEEDKPLNSYGAIKREQFEEAKDYVRNWTPDEEELKKKAINNYEKKEEKIRKAKEKLAMKQGMMTTSEVTLEQARIIKMEKDVEPYRELKEEALNK